MRYKAICFTLLLIIFLLQNYVTYREFLLYLEEYQKTNISELKIRNMRIPTPPNSPPKDCSSLSPERTGENCNQNHCCIELHPLDANV